MIRSDFGRSSDLMAASDQRRDRFDLVEEDSIKIPKPTWRAWNCDNSERAAIDPSLPYKIETLLGVIFCLPEQLLEAGSRSPGF
jgi:hypothetical protein